MEAAIEVVYAFTGVAGPPIPEEVLDPDFVGGVWQRYLETAERYNDPGRFTALIGYEWTSTEGGNNLHRNVLYRDGADLARRMNPYTTAESFNPEDLWRWMETYEQTTGGRVLTIAHNGNLSNGTMFPIETNPATGQPLTGDYAANRIRWEPVYEITQIKGDGEAHPFLSPNDEFADYGTWDTNNLGPFAKAEDMLQREYGREALKNGLRRGPCYFLSSRRSSRSSSNAWKSCISTSSQSTGPRVGSRLPGGGLGFDWEEGASAWAVSSAFEEARSLSSRNVIGVP